MGKRWPRTVVHKWPGASWAARGQQPLPGGERIRPSPGTEELPDLRTLYDLPTLMQIVEELDELRKRWETRSGDGEAEWKNGG
jgi:hypothetical protein